MAKIIKKSPVPLYLAAAVWVVWALLGPMYTWWHFAVAAGCSVGAWLLGCKLFPQRVLVLPDPEPKRPKDPLAVERERAISELQRLNRNIEDEKISQQIAHMEEVTGKIFDLVEEDRAKLPQIRRFLNYYLPTTLKLLNAYDRMDATGVDGTNIAVAMGKIADMLDKICTAFDKQLDALFAHEALDISSDIAVLEQMLASEGLSGAQLGQMEKE